MGDNFRLSFVFLITKQQWKTTPFGYLVETPVTLHLWVETFMEKPFSYPCPHSALSTEKEKTSTTKKVRSMF